MAKLGSQSTRGTQLIQTVAELRPAMTVCRVAQRRVGLVPTMGALHEGHLSLVRVSQSECQLTVVTIFVNPTQFAPNEDFDTYPRALQSDMAALKELGVDIVFAPNPAEIYPRDFSTYVAPPSVSEPLEGARRPGHFRGVATVVLKLFNLVPADVAYFGAKDFQQCVVIKRMAQDLNVPIDIRFCPIVRESDGLAMSSRNQYLKPHERQQALALSHGLTLAREMVRDGELECATIVGAVQQLLTDAGIDQIDYVAVVDPGTLAVVSRIECSSRILLAAYVGSTRLIDNCELLPNRQQSSNPQSVG